MNLNELLEKVKIGAKDAGKFAARTAKDAGKKAGEVYNTSKHQIAIFDIKNDISDLYKEIGALVYSTHKQGVETADVIEEKLAIIEEKEARIAELQEMINDIKDSKTCPSCGTKSEKSAEFCKKCGNKI